MMTSSNGNTFCVTGHLCGEFTGHRWIPLTSLTRSFDVFFHLRLNKRLSKQSWGWGFERQSRPSWRHCNDDVNTLTHCGLMKQYGHRFGSILGQAMASCLTAPSHYLTQCWLIIKCVLWYSPMNNFIRNTLELNPKHMFGDCSLQ